MERARGLSLALEVDGHHVTDITLDSYWAWQYTVIENIPEISSTTGLLLTSLQECVSMRCMFFSMRIYPLEGDASCLRGDCVGDLVVDFVELEPVGAALTFDDLEAADKVLYDSSTDLSLL